MPSKIAGLSSLSDVGYISRPFHLQKRASWQESKSSQRLDQQETSRKTIGHHDDKEEGSNNDIKISVANHVEPSSFRPCRFPPSEHIDVSNVPRIFAINLKEYLLTKPKETPKLARELA